MNRISFIIAGTMALATGNVAADEGIWTLYNLPQAVYELMQSYGFNRPYEWLNSRIGIKKSLATFGRK